MSDIKALAPSEGYNQAMDRFTRPTPTHVRQLRLAADAIVARWHALPTDAPDEEAARVVDAVLAEHQIPVNVRDLLVPDLFVRAPEFARRVNPAAAGSAETAAAIASAALRGTTARPALGPMAPASTSTPALLATHARLIARRFLGDAEKHAAELSSVAITYGLDFPAVLHQAERVFESLARHFDPSGVVTLIELAAHDGATGDALGERAIGHGTAIAARAAPDESAVGRVSREVLEGARVAHLFGGTAEHHAAVAKRLNDDNFDPGVISVAADLGVDPVVVAGAVRALVTETDVSVARFDEHLVAVSLALRAGVSPSDVLPRVVAASRMFFGTRPMNWRDAAHLAALPGMRRPDAALTSGERLAFFQAALPEALRVLTQMANSSELMRGRAYELRAALEQLVARLGRAPTLSPTESRGAGQTLTHLEASVTAALTRAKSGGAALHDATESLQALVPRALARRKEPQAVADANAKLAAVAHQNGMLEPGHLLLTDGTLTSHPTRLLGSAAARTWMDFCGRPHVLEGEVVANPMGKRPLFRTTLPSGRPALLRLEFEAVAVQTRVGMTDLERIASARGFVVEKRGPHIYRALQAAAGQRIVGLRTTADLLDLEIVEGTLTWDSQRRMFALPAADGTPIGSRGGWVAVAMPPAT